MRRIHLLFLVPLVAAGPVRATQPAALEHEVKAVYLYNLAKYVEWPAERMKSQSAIVIGLFGKDPFGSALGEAVRGRTAQDRALIIRRIATVDEALGCHMVFFGTGPAAKMRAMLEGLRGTPVLSVGETEEFVRAGGMIFFVRDGENVRFDIAQASVEAAGLQIRTPLLKLARRILSKEHTP